MTEIGDLIAIAREDPTTENLEQMWRKVFALPAWYMLPASEGPTTPLVARLDDGDWIVAFTHFRPLNAFARERGLRDEAGEIPMLALSPVESMRRLAEVTAHVSGLVFNLGTDLAFRAPHDALDDFSARFLPR